MAKYELAPTKSNLIKIKKDLSFAVEGHTLLKQKRDILIAELLSLIDTAKDLQNQIDEYSAQAFKALNACLFRMGKKELEEIALGAKQQYLLSIKSRKVMGVTLPIVDLNTAPLKPFYGFLNSSPWLDETIYHFKEIVEKLGKFTQARLSVIKLSKEVKKTIRRVNALEKIYIPDHEETLKYVQDVLEEAERESFVNLKTIKKRLQTK